MNSSEPKLIQFFLFLFLFGAFLNANAQTDKELLRELVTEEQEAVNALVLYPEEVRNDIFIAAQHPEALIKVESIQRQTSNSFQELLTSYPQDIQELIWDLTRYPNLIEKVIAPENQSKAALKRILKNYPEKIRPQAKKAAQDYLPLLMSISQLNESAESAFESILLEYPPQSRKALRQMIKLPEVLTILTSNIRLVVLVGDIYSKDPEWLHYKADSLNLLLASQNARELEDWKASLENNPEVLEELKASGDTYNEHYDYDDDEYQDFIDDLYYDAEEDEPAEVIVRHHYYHSYRYWFGYPYWYEYPRWRIYPYWYDWGFYIGRNNAVVVIGLPSYHFTQWYFYHPHHHAYWPHLSAHFVNHYYGHRKVGSSIVSSVRSWKHQNRSVINDQWLQDDKNLVRRFREYGKFETERLKHNRKKPEKAYSQSEYADRYKKRYPELSKTRKQVEEVTKVPRNQQGKEFTKPRVDIPSKEVPTKTIPKRDKKLRKKVTVPKVDKARDYHKNTWEKPKRTRVIKPRQNKAPKTFKPKKIKPTRKKQKPT